jgi:transposase
MITMDYQEGDEIFRDSLFKMYDKGLSLREIAKRNKITLSAVRWWICNPNRRSITPRSKKEAAHNFWSKIDVLKKSVK